MIGSGSAVKGAYLRVEIFAHLGENTTPCPLAARMVSTHPGYGSCPRLHLGQLLVYLEGVSMRYTSGCQEKFFDIFRQFWVSPFCQVKT